MPNAHIAYHALLRYFEASREVNDWLTGSTIQGIIRTVESDPQTYAALPCAFDCIDSQGLPRISVHPKGGMVITFDLSLRDVDAGPCRDSYHCWFMVTPE